MFRVRAYGEIADQSSGAAAEENPFIFGSARQFKDFLEKAPTEQAVGVVTEAENRQ
jgi:hypothetical protein